MSHCISNNTSCKYPMSNFGQMNGDQSCNNYSNRWNCEAMPKYTHIQPEYEDSRYMGIKNYALTRTMDGQQVFKTIHDRKYSCDCSLDNSETSHCNRNSYKLEGRKGRYNRPCDCHKRDSKQEQQERWRCYGGGAQPPRSATTRAAYEAHPHHRPASPQHRPGSPQHQPCSCAGH